LLNIDRSPNFSTMHPCLEIELLLSLSLVASHHIFLGETIHSRIVELRLVIVMVRS
jgi:hypothetical protein